MSKVDDYTKKALSTAKNISIAAHAVETRVPEKVVASAKEDFGIDLTLDEAREIIANYEANLDSAPPFDNVRIS